MESLQCDLDDIGDYEYCTIHETLSLRPFVLLLLRLKHSSSRSRECYSIVTHPSTQSVLRASCPVVLFPASSTAAALSHTKQPVNLHQPSTPCPPSALSLAPPCLSALCVLRSALPCAAAQWLPHPTAAMFPSTRWTQHPAPLRKMYTAHTTTTMIHRYVSHHSLYFVHQSATPGQTKSPKREESDIYSRRHEHEKRHGTA